MPQGDIKKRKTWQQGISHVRRYVYVTVLATSYRGPWPSPGAPGPSGTRASGRAGAGGASIAAGAGGNGGVRTWRPGSGSVPVPHGQSAGCMGRTVVAGAGAPKIIKR